MKWSRRSARLLSKAHIDLIRIFNLAILVTPIDFGISETVRDIERQKELVNTRKSRTMNSKHLRVPSEAVDIFIADKDRAYDVEHLCFVAGVVISCAELLYKNGEITHKVRWGGNWNGDKIILDDQEFDDLPHFEII